MTKPIMPWIEITVDQDIFSLESLVDDNLNPLYSLVQQEFRE
jgi:hypothetical protein